MYNTILRISMLIVVLMAVSGCIGNDGSDTSMPPGNDTNAQSQENTGMIPVSSLDDIDRSLETGAVLVMIGFDSCSACKTQKPIIEEIAAEYEGRATMMYIDTEQVGALGFSVSYVPDSFVITDVENGTYVYMKSDGQTTTDRQQARFIGLTRKAVLTQTLDHALEERKDNDQA